MPFHTHITLTERLLLHPVTLAERYHAGIRASGLRIRPSILVNYILN